jgi:hypothetical protein
MNESTIESEKLPHERCLDHDIPFINFYASVGMTEDRGIRKVAASATPTISPILPQLYTLSIFVAAITPLLT